MLLAKKPHTIQYLPRSGAGGLEPPLQIRVLLFQPVNSLRIYLGPAGCRIERFDPRF